MEVGAVKQAFNNELILLKKNLNQAKINVIHKLTRKAKQLTEKKAPEALKDKLKRKAEHAVKEVLIIKKIKARDIGKFSITHTGKLQDYLNKPLVDSNKACARLLLHKALQEKYKFIRNRFSNIPIKDLFMSRQERLKLKKEEQQKKKDKRDKKKGKGKVVNAEGDWDVEDIETGKKDEFVTDDDSERNVNDDQDMSDEDKQNSEQSEAGSDEETQENNSEEHSNDDSNADSDEEMETDDKTETKELVKLSSKKTNKKHQLFIQKETNVDKKSLVNKTPIEKLSKSKQAKQKDINKNKNLNEKILKKKFKKDSEEFPVFERKVVDPFFITASGDNYMSVAEPRAPDEVKEEHKQGNRKLRRAVMFGHVPSFKPRQKFRQEDNVDRQKQFNNRSNDKYEKQNGFGNKFDNKDNGRKIRFNDRNDSSKEDKPEKLHPSWEAKKKQSGILPFKGKKTVFDDS